MRHTALVIAASAAAMTLTAAACLRPPQPEPKGHEDTAVPNAKVEPPVAPVPAPSEGGEPVCRPLLDRVQSLVHAAPDAAIYRELAGAAAQDYIARFNRRHGTAIRGDEVALVHSPKYWGDRAIVLFQRDGCEAGMVEIEVGAPG